jgi:hypothetical protein
VDTCGALNLFRMEPQYKQPKQPAVRCPDAGRARRRQHRHIQGSAEELQAYINRMGIYILNSRLQME